MRYDFNAARSDLVFITDKGKVRGGRLASTIPLAKSLAYRPSTSAVMPQARVRLLWNAGKPKAADGTKPTRIEMVVTDGANFTGTEILSEQFAVIAYAGKPIEMQFYGLRIGIAGLTADGQLSYSAVSLGPETTIGFVFRGSVMRIIIF